MQDASSLHLFKGLVREDQANSAGQLRSDAVANLASDSFESILALRGEGGHQQGPATQGQQVRIALMSLQPVGNRLPEVGQVVDGHVLLGCTDGIFDHFDLRIVGSDGSGWQASVDVEGAAAGLGSSELQPDGLLPPVRVLRLMRPENCDQAGHVNVKVYFALVDEAVGVLCRECGLQESRLMVVRARATFMSELFAGNLVCVRSGIRTGDAKAMNVVHGIYDVSSARLACVVDTWLMPLDMAGRPVHGACPIEAFLAEPRDDWPALPPARSPTLPSAAERPDVAAIPTCIAVSDAWDCNANGFMQMGPFVNLCSTGARQYLAKIGLDGARFAREQTTIAAIDYLIDMVQRPRLGSNLTFLSNFMSGSARSLRFSHHVLDSDSNQLYAKIEIVGVMFDLAIHRPTELPVDVKARLGL